MKQGIGLRCAASLSDATIVGKSATKRGAVRAELLLALPRSMFAVLLKRSLMFVLFLGSGLLLVRSCIQSHLANRLMYS